ncbi:MAG: hypothetical protein KC609_20355 [Myxococcales bacterium]|nr:hypothetical protein [Myxococcales bacterium]
MKSLSNTTLALVVAYLSMVVGCLPSPGKSTSDAKDASVADGSSGDVVAELPPECQQSNGTYCVVGEVRDFFSDELLTELGSGNERIFVANIEKLFSGQDLACGTLLADRAKWDIFQASCTLSKSVTIENGRFVASGFRWDAASSNPQLVFGYDAKVLDADFRFTPIIQPIYGFRKRAEHVLGVVLYTIKADEMAKMIDAFPKSEQSQLEGAALARVTGVDDKSGWIVTTTGDVLASTYPCTALGCQLFGTEYQPTNPLGLIAILNPDPKVSKPREFKIAHFDQPSTTFAPQTFGMLPNFLTVIIFSPQN